MSIFKISLAFEKFLLVQYFSMYCVTSFLDPEASEIPYLDLYMHKNVCMSCILPFKLVVSYVTPI